MISIKLSILCLFVLFMVSDAKPPKIPKRHIPKHHIPKPNKSQIIFSGNEVKSLCTKACNKEKSQFTGNWTRVGQSLSVFCTCEKKVKAQYLEKKIMPRVPAPFIDWINEYRYKWSDHCYFIDQDINNGAVQVSNIEFCAQSCMQTPGCTHFDYYTDREVCNLKKGEPSEPQINDNQCGIIEPNENQDTSLARNSGVEWIENEGFWWSNYCYFSDVVEKRNGAANATNIEECGEICKNTDDCTFFDFYKHLNQCYMKKGEPGEPQKNYDQCGIVNIDWIKKDGYKWSDHCYFSDVVEKRNGAANATDIEDCAKICKKTRDCTFFDFYTDIKQCYMKKGVPGQPQTHEELCGIIHPGEEDPGVKWIQNDGYWWSNSCYFLDPNDQLDDFEVKNFNECAESCKARWRDGCTHFDFYPSDRNTCHLKKGPATVPKSHGADQCGIIETDE